MRPLLDLYESCEDIKIHALKILCQKKGTLREKKKYDLDINPSKKNIF